MITIKTWYENTGWKETTGDTVVTASQKNPKQACILLYINYTKGDESNLSIEFELKEKDIPEDKYYKVTECVGNKIRVQSFYVEESGMYVVPVPITKSHEIIKFTLYLIDADAAPGTATIYIKPNSGV